MNEFVFCHGIRALCTVATLHAGAVTLDRGGLYREIKYAE